MSTITEGGHIYTAWIYQLTNFNHCSTQVTSAWNHILLLFVLQIVITKFPWQCKVPPQIKAFCLHISVTSGNVLWSATCFYFSKADMEKVYIAFNVTFIRCSINDGSSEHIKFILSSAVSQSHILNNLLLHGITRMCKTSNTRYQKLDECNMHLGVNHWLAQSEFTVKTSSWNRLFIHTPIKAQKISGHNSSCSTTQTFTWLACGWCT
jgi:hypothetical protein